MIQELKHDIKIINETISIENQFLECIIDTQKNYENLKKEFEMDFSKKYNKLEEIINNVSENEKEEYKRKYFETFKELEKYKEKMEYLAKISQPLISKEKMDKLLYDQKVIQESINKINNSIELN
tara:strand:- start:376 stop:750 length:375 start_codon:yes stop_codon:yes gene_type:complete